jgi:hypothetical protein
LAWSYELSIATQLHGVKVVGNRVTTGVVVRALLSGKCQDRIRQFCQVMATGVPIDGDADQAAISLRNAFYEKRIDVCGVGDRGKDAYLKTESAMSSFLDRKPVFRLSSVSSEQFPIPESRFPESCRLLIV